MQTADVRQRHDPATGEPSPSKLHKGRPDRRPGGGTFLWPPLRDGSRNPNAVLRRHEQSGKLMAALATVVNSLRDFEAIVSIARDLAKRHVAYGVAPEHYALVGAALLWTLEQGLGDEFTPALRAAWEAAYGALSEVMIASAYPASQQAS